MFSHFSQGSLRVCAHVMAFLTIIAHELIFFAVEKGTIVSPSSFFRYLMIFSWFMFLVQRKILDHGIDNLKYSCLF